MKNKKRLVLLLALLLVLLAGAAGGGYAYWAGTVNAPNNEEKSIEVTIGKAKSVSTQLTINDVEENKKLVPAGKIDVSEGEEAENVDEITFTFNVKWEETETDHRADGTTGELTVSVEKAFQNSAAEGYLDLVVVTPNITTSDINLNASEDIVVTVTVKLTEPANKDAYEAIINEIIDLTITFSVEVN